MTTYNKDRIGLQEAKTLPTYSVELPKVPNLYWIISQIVELVKKHSPQFLDSYQLRNIDGDNYKYLIFIYVAPVGIQTAEVPLFEVQFRKPLPKPKTRQQIAKETLAEIIKEFDVQDSEMSLFTINQMKYAQDHATIDTVINFLDWLYGSRGWEIEASEYDKDSLHNLKIGEFKYCQNFEKIKVETLEETKYWVLNGKHTNELECGRTLVFTNFDPDESNGIDYEEFLFSYKTIGD